jgi:hypothetical protein
LGFETFVGLSGHIFVVPRFPSKSGLMNKHIVKHIVKSVTQHLFIDQQTSYRVLTKFY